MPPLSRGALDTATFQTSLPDVKGKTDDSFWHGFRWALVGNFVYAACYWGMLVMLARVGDPRLVGQFALALSVGGPVIFFTNLQLRAILASDAKREFEFADYWTLRVLMAPLALIIIGAIAWGGNFSLGTMSVILVMGLAKVIESLSDLCYGASQRNHRLDRVGKSLSIKGPISLVFLGVLVGMTQNVTVGVCGMGAAWFALFRQYDLPNVRRSLTANALISLWPLSWNWSRQRKLIAVGLPLGVSMAMLSLTMSFPNILVERFLGEHDVGVFAALTSLTWAGIPLVNAVGQAMMPRLGQLYASGDMSRLRKMVLGLFASGVALGGLGMLVAWSVGERGVTWLYGPEYADRLDLLIWLMVAASILYAVRFLSDALTAMRCIRVHVIVQGITALVVVIGGMMAVPSLGLVGMAQVLVAAFALRGAMLLTCFVRETIV